MGPCNYSNSVEAASVEREALIPGCVLMEVMVLNTECGGDAVAWILTDTQRKNTTSLIQEIQQNVAFSLFANFPDHNMCFTGQKDLKKKKNPLFSFLENRIFNVDLWLHQQAEIKTAHNQTFSRRLPNTKPNCVHTCGFKTSVDATRGYLSSTEP